MEKLISERVLVFVDCFQDCLIPFCACHHVRVLPNMEVVLIEKMALFQFGLLSFELPRMKTRICIAQTNKQFRVMQQQIVRHSLATICGGAEFVKVYDNPSCS